MRKSKLMKEAKEMSVRVDFYHLEVGSRGITGITGFTVIV